MDRLENQRLELIRFIFKEDNLPAGYPDKITKYKDDLSEDGEKYAIYMQNNITTDSYLYKSKVNSSKLMIFISGHFCEVRICHSEDISYFLKKNYSVLAFSLPSADNDASHSDHSGFARYESDNFSSVSYFMEPIALSLNYAIDRYGYNDISMTGISGGGWTTTLYAAIDIRIKRSYPVAGTLPNEYLAEADRGDYEYRLEPLYEVADYYDMYVLGASPKDRTQVQILNHNDECCFQGSLYLNRPYESLIDSRLNAVKGGNFTVFVVNESRHIYSSKSLERIR